MTPFHRFLAAAALGAALATGGAGAGQAAEAGLLGAQSYPGESYAQYYGPRRGYYRRGPSGGAVAAGVIGGLALGALAGAAIAGSAPPPGPGYAGGPVGNVYGRDPHWVEYCAGRYRSFDVASGTYLGRDGLRYPCQ